MARKQITIKYGVSKGTRGGYKWTVWEDGALRYGDNMKTAGGAGRKAAQHAEKLAETRRKFCDVAIEKMPWSIA